MVYQPGVVLARLKGRPLHCGGAANRTAIQTPGPLPKCTWRTSFTGSPPPHTNCAIWTHLFLDASPPLPHDVWAPDEVGHEYSPQACLLTDWQRAPQGQPTSAQVRNVCALTWHVAVPQTRAEMDKERGGPLQVRFALPQIAPTAPATTVFIAQCSLRGQEIIHTQTHTRTRTHTHTLRTAKQE